MSASAIRSKTSRHGPRYQSGLSLIELMISLVIGMMIVITIGYVYLGASTTFRSLEASSRIQENVRFAFERIAFDIRMAGFVGCAYNKATAANVLNLPTPPVPPEDEWMLHAFKLFDRPLTGYEEGETVATLPDPGVVLRGDVITILRADNSQEYILDTHNPSSAQFQLFETHDLKQGELLVVTDCKHAALFQMTNVNNNNTIKTINHNTGGGTPGNSTKDLGYPVSLSDPLDPNSCVTPTGPCRFPTGSRILRMSPSTYYVGKNAADDPVLYRQQLRADSSGDLPDPEELVDGIENMQLLYGVDTSATADGAVDVYVTATDVPTNAPGANLEEQWSRVLAVQISLLAVSKSDKSVNTQAQDYVFNGATVTPTDRLMRRAFTTTIAVRNRL